MESKACSKDENFIREIINLTELISRSLIFPGIIIVNIRERAQLGQSLRRRYNKLV